MSDDCIVDPWVSTTTCPSTFCNLYDATGSVWPTTQFPSDEFLTRYGSAELVSARKAWNLFERVEAQDAATRVRLSTTGWNPSSAEVQIPCTWYRFKSNEERITYERGRALHAELCPDFCWTSQRNRPLTAPPVNVYPERK